MDRDHLRHIDTSELVFPGHPREVHFAEARWGPPGPAGPGTRRLSDAPTAPLVGTAPALAPWLTPAPQHPHLERIVASLERWRSVHEALTGSDPPTCLVTLIWPLSDVRATPGMKGSTSGHDILPDGHRVAYFTVDDVDGGREALLHEWGHLRLRAFGIDLEDHDGWLLASSSAERLISPIRRDKLRPPSAVVHAAYVWTLFTHGDLLCGEPEAIRPMAETNLCKIEECRIVLDRWVRWTEAGAPFGRELRAWMDDVVEMGWEVLGPEHRQAALDRYVLWVRTTAVPYSLLVDDIDDAMTVLADLPR